jgi:ribosomal protein L37AE/L43A
MKSVARKLAAELDDARLAVRVGPGHVQARRFEPGPEVRIDAVAETRKGLWPFQGSPLRARGFRVEAIGARKRAEPRVRPRSGKKRHRGVGQTPRPFDRPRYALRPCLLPSRDSRKHPTYGLAVVCPGDAGGNQRKGDTVAEPVPAGSDVSAGTYRCTNCGNEITMSSQSSIPPCPSCGKGQWETVQGGDSTKDPYPNS